MDDFLPNYKLSILYLLDNISWPVNTTAICDVLLEELFSNYFHLQQALSELEEGGMIHKETTGNSTYYSMTPSGKEAFVYLKNSLSEELRKAIMDRVRELHIDTRKTLSARADYSMSVIGRCHVRCQLMEEKDTVIDLTLRVPGVQAAKEICSRWPSRSQMMYEKLIDELM